ERVLHSAEVDLSFAAAGNSVEKLHAEFAEFEAGSDGGEGAFLLGIESMGRRSVTDVERIFGGIERFFPAFEFALAEEAFDDRAGKAGKSENLWQRKGAALDGEEILEARFPFKECPGGFVRGL